MTNHDAAAFAFACMLDDVCRCIRNGYDHSALMYLGEVEGARRFAHITGIAPEVVARVDVILAELRSIEP